MAIDALVKPFLRLPLFQGLKPLQLTEIVRRADRIVYRAGDVIIQEDKPGEAAIVIVSGEAVRTSLADGNTAESVPEGSMVGELAMLIEIIHSSTVIARGPVRALRLTRDEMHALMSEDPLLADHLTQKISARLHRLAAELQEIDQALADIATFETGSHITHQKPATGFALH